MIPTFFAPMADFKKGWDTNSATIHTAAINRLDDLTLSPWRKNSNESDAAARARRKIEILKATNELDAMELLGISRSCNACSPDDCQGRTKQFWAADLAEGLIDEAKEKLRRMEVIATRIKNRSYQVNKLECLLKLYGNDLDPASTMCLSSGIEYTPKLDRLNSITPVTQDLHNNSNKNSSDNSDNKSTQSQKRVRPIDLLDSDVPLFLNSPVLPLTRTSPVPPTLPSLAPAPTANTSRNHCTEIGKTVTSTSHPHLPIPKVDIWDSEAEREAAFRALLGVYRGPIDLNSRELPLFFTKGINHRPSPETQTVSSRMVVFSGLHPATTYSELLDKVRGGPIARVARADGTTAAVTFVSDSDASRYASYANDPRRSRLRIRGARRG